MTLLERVPASRLRPGDVLYACDRPCVVAEVHAGKLSVRLRLNRSDKYESTRAFTVPHSTHFRRVRQSRRINTRPDLGARRGTRGTATQSPEFITERLRDGYVR